MSTSSSSAAAASDDFLARLEEHRRELAAHHHVQSDLDFAFKLQLQESLTASLSSAAAASSSAAVPVPSVVDFLDAEIDRIQREHSDEELSRSLQAQTLADLRVRFHDRGFAEEMERIPDPEWESTGNWFEKPLEEEGNNVGPVFRVCCKGIIGGGGGGEGRVVAAAGIVVVGAKGEVEFEVAKPVAVEEEVREEVVEVVAVLEGLDLALSLGLKKVTFGCEKLVYQWITGERRDMDETISKLVGHVNLCQKNFIQCTPLLLKKDDNSCAYKLARAAINTQMSKPEGYNLGKDLKETCVICLEETALPLMFTVDSCQHRCCNFCVKKHVEVKLYQRVVPKCPYISCKIELNVQSCQKLLGPELHELMSQLVKEASIPVTEKVYCPDPRCSTLMSRSKVLEYSNARSGSVQEFGSCLCVKCQKPFCISCNVPWHSGMSCHAYKKLKSDLNSTDSKLKMLATSKRWRQCVKCKHMIELAEGCYHIYCKCGYQFCYTCGAEWKNKKATCTCRLWDERNIIRVNNAGLH
ncbi:E3 ubiquitin-protein ligase RSL1-like protein [Drosera capensis]